MIDFVQLKKVAQEAQESQVPFTINSTQILELLAIQAQLVEALKMMLNCDGASGSFGKRVEAVNKATAALAAAGAQP